MGASLIGRDGGAGTGDSGSSRVRVAAGFNGVDGEETGLEDSWDPLVLSGNKETTRPQTVPRTTQLSTVTIMTAPNRDGPAKGFLETKNPSGSAVYAQFSALHRCRRKAIRSTRLFVNPAVDAPL